MDKETYERQKAFAGEKVPSMHRRMLEHAYQERQMYMITMVTEGRRPLLGKVEGRSDGAPGTSDEPRTVPTELGLSVEQCWREIGFRYPQIEVLGFQLMPDHFHGILFVKERIEKPLGKVLLGFKQGCNKAFRALVPSVAVVQQQTGRGRTNRKHGLLFEPNYNDKLLLQAGQLQRWHDYLRDNPRRLLMKTGASRPFPCTAGPDRGGYDVLGHRQPFPPAAACLVASAMLPSADRGGNTGAHSVFHQCGGKGGCAGLAVYFARREGRDACRL